MMENDELVNCWNCVNHYTSSGVSLAACGCELDSKFHKHPCNRRWHKCSEYEGLSGERHQLLEIPAEVRGRVRQ